MSHADSPDIMSIAEQIANVTRCRPHVVLLGAGASKAALPTGDRNGRQVPLLRDVATDLALETYFPPDLKALAVSDFEAAYSRLFDGGLSAELNKVNELVSEYFSELELPDSPNLYDTLLLSLRPKDAIFTFNWDPFLLQSYRRLGALGLGKHLPEIHFLHGNVMVGICLKDKKGGILGHRCSVCHQFLEPSTLLYPVEHEDYQSDLFIADEWRAMQNFLKETRYFTIFGYSAPITDKEAVDLLKQGWGRVEDREMEQTEIINRPGADEDELRKTWKPFIHTHHYQVVGSFYDSFLARHPRRSMEAYWNQYFEVKWLEEHKIPEQFNDFDELIAFFQPLFDAEDAAGPDNI